MPKGTKRTQPPSGAGIRRESDGEWEWFVRDEPAPYDISGKYLFFSSDRDLLVRIALEELQAGIFHEAKIPMPGHNVSSDYVLCLYYRDDSLKHDLAAKYRVRQDVRYRYWKSDEATLDGQYSPEFLENLRRELNEHVRPPKRRPRR